MIAAGKTARSESNPYWNVIKGGYLDRLEFDYALYISKHKPINAKPLSRLQKYKNHGQFSGISGFVLFIGTGRRWKQAISVMSPM